MEKNKVLVAMSGGVDSTLAVYLLKKQGFDVSGVTMSIWGGEFNVSSGKKGGCYSPDEKYAISRANKLAKKLGIKHVTVDLKKEYKKNVLDYFCSEYLCGKTPNPCTVCNSKIKFGFLIDKAKKGGLKFDYFATGHYVRIAFDKKTGRFLLKKGKDALKDQSYFLWRLKQNRLKQLMFPLGNLTKKEVKNLACKIGLKQLAKQSESQDFIDRKYHEGLFVGKKIKSGYICDSKGKILAAHKGIIHYTIGQRKGLGIGGTKEPIYVTNILPKENKIIVGSKKDLFSKELIAGDLNWIAVEKLQKAVKIKAKIRLQHKEQECVVSPFNKGKVKVVFKKPQMAITPGQSVVFYKGTAVFGGGVIEKL